MIFSTKRLIIREFKPSDLEAIHSYASLEHVVQYQAWGPNTLEETKSFLENAISYINQKPRFNYELCITLKDSEEQIGGCGIFIKKENPTIAMLGYTLNPDFWKKGYATEATKGLVEFGFQNLKLKTIQATCDVKNIGSRKVLERNEFQLLEIIENHSMQKGKLRSSFLFDLERN